ncbi:MAG: tetratricopeptide repeat protein [Pseudomonadota bacterium]
MIRFLLPAAILLAASPAAAQLFKGPEAYAACIAIAKAKPEQGWEEALAWQSLGGGEAARHCAAVALIGLGKHKEAAHRLETLANESRRDEATRAEMLGQAAQAWLLAGETARADAAQRAALGLAPGHPDLLIDHAVLLAQVGRYDEAADRLSAVLAAQPNRVEALVLRASARRYLDDLAGARADIARAVELDPLFPDALLERGMLSRLAGDDKAARADWMRAIDLNPEGAAADLARENLAKLDVKVKDGDPPRP